ncbi:hypothetical protein MF271_22280 (plasmid) [Deinococcus sp. KNUC1210]|uniref:hypothetical protein n=1 Tax=Deinococcus sp. KNUC1210 TaxID=2917691 RepID=UPI001EF046DE|nr:hypothetical protein [Deinococcus sp. KNUC1210]ULH18200.1 hypothetical protein MF271_22280 [Deinococcus sp. KNUC1210]
MPYYKEWLQADPNRPEFMLIYNLRFTSFAAVLDVINPTIQYICGMYIRVSQFSDPNDYKSYIGVNLSLEEIESRVNRLRIYDIFQHDIRVDEVGSRLLTLFVQEIRKCWELNLKLKYPDKNFQVVILDLDVDPEVTFFQVRA